MKNGILQCKFSLKKHVVIIFLSRFKIKDRERERRRSLTHSHNIKKEKKIKGERERKKKVKIKEKFDRLDQLEIVREGFRRLPFSLPSFLYQEKKEIFNWKKEGKKFAPLLFLIFLGEFFEFYVWYMKKSPTQSKNG